MNVNASEGHSRRRSSQVRVGANEDQRKRTSAQARANASESHRKRGSAQARFNASAKVHCAVLNERKRKHSVSFCVMEMTVSITNTEVKSHFGEGN